MSQPFNSWYHCTSHTYGAWLRGDPRGWRARHHREHVEGDYRNPPASGSFDRHWERSKRLMTRDPVRIERALRKIVVNAVTHRLEREQLEILVASVDGTHLHLVGRFPDHRPRHWVGLAKYHATFRLKELGLAPEGGLWAKRGKQNPVNDRSHQLNSIKYVLDHELKGAAVWLAPEIANWARLYRAQRDEKLKNGSRKR